MTSSTTEVVSNVDKHPCRALRCDCQGVERSAPIAGFDYCACGHTTNSHYTPTKTTAKRG